MRAPPPAFPHPLRFPRRSGPRLPAPAATPAPFVRSLAAELSWRSASLGWARLALAGLHGAPLRSASLASASLGSDLPGSAPLGSAPLGSTRLGSASGRAGSGRAYGIGPSLYPLLAVDPVRGPDSERGDRVRVAA